MGGPRRAGIGLDVALNQESGIWSQEPGAWSQEHRGLTRLNSLAATDPRRPRCCRMVRSCSIYRMNFISFHRLFYFGASQEVPPDFSATARSGRVQVAL
jgi:hypothetical protein